MLSRLSSPLRRLSVHTRPALCPALQLSLLPQQQLSPFSSKRCLTALLSSPQLSYLPIRFSRPLSIRGLSTSTSSTQDKLGKKFMVCIDGSENATKALDVAKGLMKIQENDLLVLVTVPPLVQTNQIIGEELYNSLLQLRDEGVARLILDAENRCQDIKENVYSVIGEPAGGPREELVRIAEQENVDFIILGSRGLTALKRIILGSVSSYVVQHAQRNVLIVR